MKSSYKLATNTRQGDITIYQKLGEDKKRQSTFQPTHTLEMDTEAEKSRKSIIQIKKKEILWRLGLEQPVSSAQIEPGVHKSQAKLEASCWSSNALHCVP